MAGRLMALLDWFDSRMPSVGEEWRKHAAEYYAPKNFNFWTTSGRRCWFWDPDHHRVFLTMHYKPTATSRSAGGVECSTCGRWIIRYIHSPLRLRSTSSLPAHVPRLLYGS